MAVFQQCPTCKKIIALKNDRCRCSEDLVKARSSRRIRYWVVYKLPDRRQKKEPVGYSLKDTQDRDAEVTVDKANGKAEAKASNWTYWNLFKWYEKQILPDQKLKSKSRVSDAFRAWEEVLGHIIVNKTQTSHLEKFKNYRLEVKGRAPSTVVKELLYVAKAVLLGAKNRKIARYVHRDIFDARENPILPKKKGRPLTIPDYLGLVQVASDELKSFLVAGFNTGMRFGELAQLTWGHIDLEKNIIRIPRDLCKEGKGRRPKTNDKIIPINYRLKELLRGFTRGLPMAPVFTYRGKPYERSPKKAFRGACERAGIPYGQKVEEGVTFKSLRDTFISLALAAGVDYIHVQLMVGHSLPGVLDHYVDLSEAALHNSMQKYTNYTDDLVAQAQEDMGEILGENAGDESL